MRQNAFCDRWGILQRSPSPPIAGFVLERGIGKEEWKGLERERGRKGNKRERKREGGGGMEIGGLPVTYLLLTLLTLGEIDAPRASGSSPCYNVNK